MRSIYELLKKLRIFNILTFVCSVHILLQACIVSSHPSTMSDTSVMTVHLHVQSAGCVLFSQ